MYSNPVFKSSRDVIFNDTKFVHGLFFERNRIAYQKIENIVLSFMFAFHLIRHWTQKTQRQNNMICKIREDLDIGRKFNDVASMALQNNKLTTFCGK